MGWAHKLELARVATQRQPNRAMESQLPVKKLCQGHCSLAGKGRVPARERHGRVGNTCTRVRTRLAPVAVDPICICVHGVRQFANDSCGSEPRLGQQGRTARTPRKAVPHGYLVQLQPRLSRQAEQLPDDCMSRLSLLSVKCSCSQASPGSTVARPDRELHMRPKVMRKCCKHAPGFDICKVSTPCAKTALQLPRI